MNPGNSLYDDAELYDAEFGGYRGDLRFYRHVLTQHPGPVLEIGCGTGRLCFQLAPAHYIGVDAAAPMLRRFRARAQRQGVEARGLQADARRLPVPDGAISVVILAYNVVQHMMDAAALTACLTEARRVISSAGTVALDTFMPPLPGVVREDPDFGWTEQRRHPDGSIIDVAEQTRLDATTGVQRTRLRFSPGGAPAVVHDVTRRLWSDADLRGAISASGLVLAELWGDVDGEAWDERSPRFMARCVPV